ncbi:hypothetical protein ACTGXY_11415, partial [Streptococcus suis]
LSVMAGPLASDPYSIGAPTSDLRAPVADGAAKGLRIGWVEHFGRYRTDPEVARLTRAAVMALAGAAMVSLGTSPAQAVVYCKTVGVPKGCLVR